MKTKRAGREVSYYFLMDKFLSLASISAALSARFVLLARGSVQQLLVEVCGAEVVHTSLPLAIDSDVQQHL